MRASPTDILARKSSRVGQNEDPCPEVGEEVRVGVGFRVGPVEFKL